MQREAIEQRVKRSAAAQRVFSGSDGELVLDELRKFCGEGSFLYDPAHADIVSVSVKAGKRDVMTFLDNMLNASDLERGQALLKQLEEQENAGTEEGRKEE